MPSERLAYRGRLRGRPPEEPVWRQAASLTVG